MLKTNPILKKKIISHDSDIFLRTVLLFSVVPVKAIFGPF